MKSRHMKEVKEDQDLAKASSLNTEAIQEHVIHVILPQANYHPPSLSPTWLQNHVKIHGEGDE